MTPSTPRLVPTAVLTMAALAAAAPAVLAQDIIPSHCIALSQAQPERLWHAGFGEPLARDQVRLHYVGHATFTLETPGGQIAATDYTGFLGNPDVVPDVVTMNNSHSTHWTSNPDPRIPHVLSGWPQDGQPAWHELETGDLLVRNVTTDTRGPFGEGARANGNSIFIFEAAGLCIGHLGHLHQIPSPAQYAAIGRLDVVMVPVDGGYTMDVASMAGVVKELRASVVVPMHWFSGASLEQFLVEMSSEFEIRRAGGSEAEFSLASLPDRPTVLVLEPSLLP